MGTVGETDMDGGQARISAGSAFTRMGEENAFAVLARAAELTAEGRDVVNLGIGQPDFPTPPHIVEAAIKALRDGAHGYTPATGILPLREAVANDLNARHGLSDRTAVDPGSVVVVPGGKVTMYAAIRMLGAKGAEILYPDPGFPIYRSMIEATGATPVPLAARGLTIDVDEALSLITPKTRLVIVNSPSNPTGGVLSRAEVDRLVEGLAAHPHVAILSDEIYDRLLYGEAEHRSLLAYPEIRDRLILLNGVSKTYAMTGWRLGYAVWPDALLEPMRKLCVNAWSCVNAATQHAAIAALKGPQDAVETMRQAFDARRRLTVETLNAIPNVTCETPEGAFYAFPDISATGWKAKPLAKMLLEDAGVALVGGPDFGVHGEGYLRVSYANSEENIARALERVRAALEAKSPE